MVGKDWCSPANMSDTYAAALSCLLPALLRGSVSIYIYTWMSDRDFVATNVWPHTWTYMRIVCWRKGGTACPNSGSSITLVRKDSEGQGGAKEEGTTGRKGSDVNESSNLSCHVRSKVIPSLSSMCACVCVRWESVLSCLIVRPNVHCPVWWPVRRQLDLVTSHQSEGRAYMCAWRCVCAGSLKTI